jgi:hypothetical protein
MQVCGGIEIVEESMFVADAYRINKKGESQEMTWGARLSAPGKTCGGE